MDTLGLELFSEHAVHTGSFEKEKGKKKRTMFSAEQKSLLESQFLSNPYPDKLMRKRLADELNVKDKSIDYWFGHRRAKCAKQKKGSSDSESISTPEDTVDSPAPLPMPPAKKEKLVQMKSPTSVMDPFGVYFHAMWATVH